MILAIASHPAARSNSHLSVPLRAPNFFSLCFHRAELIAGLSPGRHNSAMEKILNEHCHYLSDQIRLERYETAINQTVSSGCTVLDLGCGSGVLGLMAFRAGAKQVYFVDETAIIEMARHAVEQAGFSDRAQFFRTNSYELELPERVDVVICDHVGCFGIDYGVLGVLADARQRFLKPDGILMPQQINVMLAPIESEDARSSIDRWRDGSVPEDFAWVTSLAANTKHLVELTGDELLADASTIASLQPGSDTNEFHRWDVEFTCARNGSFDGLAGWFDCGITDEVRMTNSPQADDHTIRPQVFLPLETPWPVGEGDRINATLMVRHEDNVIAWTIEMPDTGQRATLTTFNSLLFDRESMTRMQPNRRAELNDRGRARQIVASYCDGSRTVAEIEALMHEEHAGLFPSELALESFVRRVLAKDTSD